MCLYSSHNEELLPAENSHLDNKADTDLPTEDPVCWSSATPWRSREAEFWQNRFLSKGTSSSPLRASQTQLPPAAHSGHFLCTAPTSKHGHGRQRCMCTSDWWSLLWCCPGGSKLVLWLQFNNMQEQPGGHEAGRTVLAVPGLATWGHCLHMLAVPERTSRNGFSDQVIKRTFTVRVHPPLRFNMCTYNYVEPQQNISSVKWCKLIKSPVVRGRIITIIKCLLNP